MRSFLRHLLSLTAVCTNFSQFYELLIATLLNEKHGQNTFISAELNRVAFVYFKTEMERFFILKQDVDRGVS